MTYLALRIFPCMKVIYTLVLGVVCWMSCRPASQSILLKYPALTANFSDEQIAGLDSIRQFFIDEACRISDKNKPEDCLSTYLENLRQKALAGPVELGLAPDQHNNFVTALSSMVREAIWEPGLMVQDRLVDSINVTDTIQVLNLRMGGKYMLFLQSLAKENPKIKYYLDTFNASGDISPLLFGDVMQNYREYNLQDPQVQLVLAVHYLTIQDHFLQIQAAKGE